MISFTYCCSTTNDLLIKFHMALILPFKQARHKRISEAIINCFLKSLDNKSPIEHKSFPNKTKSLLIKSFFSKKKTNCLILALGIL